jgi:hypothetical protein
MNRLVPLTGVLAVAAIVASFVMLGETPDANAPVNEVVSFYDKHDSDAQWASALLALGSLAFLIFSSTIAGALRRAQGETGGASALAHGGGIVFAAGLAIFAGLTFALGDVGNEIEPSAAQAISVLNEDLYFPLAVGATAFLLGSAVAILKTGALPKWLAWLAIVGVVISLTPVGFIGIAVLGLFTVISSIVLSMRADTAGARAR